MAWIRLARLPVEPEALELPGLPSCRGLSFIRLESPLLTRRQLLRRLGIATGITLGFGPLHDLDAVA